MQNFLRASPENSVRFQKYVWEVFCTSFLSEIVYAGSSSQQKQLPQYNVCIFSLLHNCIFSSARLEYSKMVWYKFENIFLKLRNIPADIYVWGCCLYSHICSRLVSSCLRCIFLICLYLKKVIFIYIYYFYQIYHLLIIINLWTFDFNTMKF